MEWSKTHVTSTLHICWGAQAGLYYHYGVEKHPKDEKISGIFAHTVNIPNSPIARGFDDSFLVPHSRHTEVLREDIEEKKDLEIISESTE